jgi:hypothetical protein
MLGQYLGQEAGDLGEPNVVERWQGAGAEEGGDGGVGQVALGSVTAGIGMVDALLAGPVKEFFDQPGLADAGLAQEQDETGAAGGAMPGGL